MARFLNDAILRICDESQRWQLVRPLKYVSEAGDLLTVSPGFLTDLASIPRALHWLIPVNGKHREAAILHDWLYVTQPCTRAEADRLFLEAMAHSRVSWAERTAMFCAVRIWGWLVWRKYSRARARDLFAFLRSFGLLSAGAPPANPATNPAIAIKGVCTARNTATNSRTTP